MKSFGIVACCGICNGIRPEKLAKPDCFITLWFKKWNFICGSCKKQVVKFSIFPRKFMQCPWCETNNYPEFTLMG